MDKQVKKFQLLTKLTEKYQHEKSATSSIRWVTDHWEAHGDDSIKKLELALGLDFKNDENTKTIGDLFIKLLGRVANPGDQIIMNDLSFLALNTKGKQVGRVMIHPSTH